MTSQSSNSISRSLRDRNWKGLKNGLETMSKPIQDKYVATLWLDDAIKYARSKGYKGGLASGVFLEKMIKEKFRVELWHIEYIAQKFNFKPTWAQLTFEKILPQHK